MGDREALVVLHERFTQACFVSIKVLRLRESLYLELVGNDVI